MRTTATKATTAATPCPVRRLRTRQRNACVPPARCSRTQNNYAGEILSSTGVSNRALPMVIGAVQLAGILSAAGGADRYGRRPLLLGSCVLTAFW